MNSIHAHWRQWWREFSTWMITAGSSMIFFAPELSEALLYVWSIVPLDIKTNFDPDAVRYFGYAIAICAIPAKYVKQKSPDRDVAK